MLNKLRIVVLLAASLLPLITSSCRAAATRPSVEPPLVEKPAAAPRPSTVPAQEYVWAPYIEPIELPALARNGAVRAFLDGYGVVTEVTSSKIPTGLLDVEAAVVIDFPPFQAEHEVRPTLRTSPTGQYVVATFLDEEAGRVEYEVFRRATMRWEAAGGFDLLDFASDHDPDTPGLSRHSTQLNDESFVSRISDGVRNMTARSFQLDTSVWVEVPHDALEPNACLIPCAGSDRVRWGGNLDENELACASIRRSTDAPWRRIETEEPLYLRSCAEVGDDRVLVVGGLDPRRLFMVGSTQAEIVDVEAGTVRSLDDAPHLGSRVELPDDPDRIGWFLPGSVVWFDPVAETFIQMGDRGEVTAYRWTLQIDGVTAIAVDQDKSAWRYGLRQTQTATESTP